MLDFSRPWRNRFRIHWQLPGFRAFWSGGIISAKWIQDEKETGAFSPTPVQICFVHSKNKTLQFMKITTTNRKGISNNFHHSLGERPPKYNHFTDQKTGAIPSVEGPVLSKDSYWDLLEPYNHLVGACTQRNHSSGDLHEFVLTDFNRSAGTE